MSAKPVRSQLRDLLQGPRLLEEVAGTGDDAEFTLDPKLPPRRLVERDDLRVVAADDQQRRRSDFGQGLAGQIGAAAAPVLAPK